MSPILKVALPLPLPTLFDYRLDSATVGPAMPVPTAGCRVRVPFGRRDIVGVVIGSAAASGVDAGKLKTVSDVLDREPLLTEELMATLAWAARYYQHPLGEVIAAALPAALRTSRTLPVAGIAGLRLTAAGSAAAQAPVAQRGTRRAALLAALAAGPLSIERIESAFGRAGAVLRGALAAGLVERVRLSAALPPAPTLRAPELNDEQAAAAAAIKAGQGYATYLLDGVTGSGKTEVYLDLIDACLARQRQVLVLVPEIALTPQTLRRFRQRLGIDIAALHSGLGDGERLRAWLAAARGEARVVVGTRSAALVPLPNAGAIIVDEEHDASYKQQDGWRYHARDVAVLRARALDVPIVLGSATPSLESLANARQGRYRHLRLHQRAGFAVAPSVRVVDLRRQRLESGLAAETVAAIRACLARDEQVLVFRNRRGYAPVLMCHDCGWRSLCPACERALTLHRADARLRCHHCGFATRVPPACPDCGSLAVHALGHGTERLEENLAAMFPDTPIVRVDRDTTRGRKTREALLESLPASGARILVGTQMLAKGHDLPHLTLVVVVGVDEGLFSVDFRASERLGQLVVQVAGRAGRAERSGRVILQSRQPEHPLLQLLLAGGYHALADQLLGERRDAGLPPFVQLALLRAEAKTQLALDMFLGAAIGAVDDSAIVAHGPLAAPMPRRAGVLRGQVLIEAGERTAMQAFLPSWLDSLRALPGERALRWSIDVDPVDLY